MQVVGRPGSDRSINFDDRITQITELDMDGDFGGRAAICDSPATMARCLQAAPDRCLVGVLKKHYSPLQKLGQWFSDIALHFPGLYELPLLVIDDEMDEAGPNTGGEETAEKIDQGFDPDEDEDIETEETQIVPGLDEPELDEDEPDVDEPSTTNQAITGLLKDQYFGRRMYLGFTATPYAIILHRRREPDSDQYALYGPDIFPDHYLLVLDDAPAYCGGDVFVGRTEVLVRDMFRGDDGRLQLGAELLHLPAFDGVDGTIEPIPSRECCNTCFEERDGDGERVHGPQRRRQSHCRHSPPAEHWPIDREGEGRCSCSCHSEDEVHQLVPPFTDIFPDPDDADGDERFEYARMVPSLVQAINDFILAGAARAERGDASKPCTMMINASHRWQVHLDIRELVLAHLRKIAQIFSSGLEAAYLADLRTRWDVAFAPAIRAFNGFGEESPEPVILEGGGSSTDEPERVLAAATGSESARPERTTEFSAIQPFLAPFIHEVVKPENHRVLNSRCGDVVDYDEEPGLKAIIHGGYNLGRGLTFKGLVTAYLVRGHGDMSGLMQMQRWCGYRGEDGGERILDLMRIYMTDEDRELFQRMLAIEKKNRYLLSTYVRRDRTPEQFATVLEQDQDTPLMSAAKSGALRNVGKVLSGREKTQRTFEFHRSESVSLEENLQTLAAWLTDLADCEVTGHDRPGYIYKDVPTKSVLQLLDTWNMVDTRGFDCSEIKAWIARLQDWTELHPNDESQLTHWTVYVPSRNPENPVKVGGGHVEGFDPRQPIDLGQGKTLYPYPYTLDRGSTNRLKTIRFSRNWESVDSMELFGGLARRESHGLLLVSAAIHPLNRNEPGGAYGTSNPCPDLSSEDMHKAGDWPTLLALGFWFPSTQKLTTELVRHGDVWND